MGRTYRGNNRKAKQKNFDVNFSGADVLGLISFEVGFYSISKNQPPSPMSQRRIASRLVSHS